MAEAYLGEIRMFAGNFAPAGWALCNGQELSISENDALFSLLGTAYGGDGQTTFALPDLRGRIPIHRSETHILGEQGGVEAVTLTIQELPSHKHEVLASSNEGTGGASGNVLGREPIYTSKGDSVSLAGPTLSATGGSQPHQNMQPSLCVNFIICLAGVYPPKD